MNTQRKMNFADYNFDKVGYIPPPPPSLNGGLYTGTPFQKNAPWANVPVVPDTTFILQNNLPKDAPFQAKYQYPPTRQGNSHVEWTGLQKYEGTAINSGPFEIYCAPCKPIEKKCYCDDICPKHQTKYCNKTNCVKHDTTSGFHKYYYI